MKGYVHSIETFGLVDGPGVRFVVFLSGCAMRCKFCHNPDSWHLKGTETLAEDLLKKALRYKNYWKNGGGITVSGGEPMLQAEFVTELFTLAKAEGIHTTLDTAGQPWNIEDEKYKKLLDVTDLVLLDIKEIDDEAHIQLTGVTNKNIIEFAHYLSDIKKPTWIRHVLVPKLTDSEESLKKTKELVDSLKSVEKIEILPYHSLGKSKWEKLGIDYPLKDTPAPTDEEVKLAESILYLTKQN